MKNVINFYFINYINIDNHTYKYNNNHNMTYGLGVSEYYLLAAVGG